MWGALRKPPGGTCSRPGSGFRHRIAMGPKPIRCGMGHRGQVEAHRARTRTTEKPDSGVRLLDGSTSLSEETASDQSGRREPDRVRNTRPGDGSPWAPTQATGPARDPTGVDGEVDAIDRDLFATVRARVERHRSGGGLEHGRRPDRQRLDDRRRRQSLHRFHRQRRGRRPHRQRLATVATAT